MFNYFPSNFFLGHSKVVNFLEENEQFQECFKHEVDIPPTAPRNPAIMDKTER